MEASDSALISRVLEGEIQVYAQLVARHRDRLGRFAMHMLGNREDAEEALQDAFVRAYRALGSCEDPERFGAWLFRILTNRCRTMRVRRTRRHQTFVQDEIALESAAEQHPAENSALREEIARALERLDSAQREAFLLKHVEGLEYEEMAEITGVGISALKMRVKRACDRLRELLSEVHHV